MYNFLSSHRKVIVAIVGVMVNLAVTFFANDLQATIYLNVVISGLAAAGVYQAYNAPRI